MLYLKCFAVDNIASFVTLNPVVKIMGEKSLIKTAIADVANSKRHQRLDEIFIFLPALYWKLAKLFVRKLC